MSERGVNDSLLGNTEKFVEEILQRVEGCGIEMADLAMIDHVCYRVETDERYEEMKDAMTSIATLAGEVEVNGRMISTHRLFSPIVHDGWRIDGVELPAPKEGAHYSEGLEHVEFVIYDQLDDFARKYSTLDFDMRAIDRGVNPELGFTLDSCDYSVKFHRIPLLAVVEIVEPKAGITKVFDGM